MEHIFYKKHKYLLSQLKTIAVGLVAAVVFYILEDQKTFFPSVIAASICGIWFIINLRRYRYSKYIKVGETQIEEGKYITSWSDVSYVKFTTDRGGPYILIRSEGKKRMLIAQQYDRPLELRELLESICAKKGISYKVDDRASYGDYDGKKKQINPLNIFGGLLVAWAPLLLLALIIFLEVIIK